MVNLYGLSREERLEAYDPKLDFLKPYINCLVDRNCRICDKRTACTRIALRKKRGKPNPWSYQP